MLSGTQDLHEDIFNLGLKFLGSNRKPQDPIIWLSLINHCAFNQKPPLPKISLIYFSADINASN